MTKLRQLIILLFFIFVSLGMDYPQKDKPFFYSHKDTLYWKCDGDFDSDEWNWLKFQLDYKQLIPTMNIENIVSLDMSLEYILIVGTANYQWKVYHHGTCNTKEWFVKRIK